jgi:hypothetical protein
MQIEEDRLIHEVARTAQRYSGSSETISPELRIYKDLNINGSDFVLFVEELQQRYQLDLRPLLSDEPRKSVNPRSLMEVLQALKSALTDTSDARDPTIREFASYIAANSSRA